MNLQYYLEHFAVSVSAISGVLAARGKQVDLFGVLVLAVVTAFGGGTLRDLLLGALPVMWMQDTTFLYNALISALATFAVVRFRELPETELLVADAFALALFTIVGARKAMSFHSDPVVVVTMGVITGVAGGLLRDTLLQEIPVVFRRETYYYATASLCGSGVYVAMQHWLPDLNATMVAAVLVTLLLRLISLRWKFTLPAFESGRANEGPDARTDFKRKK
jgi:uncharacterized membrane protein YeiH